MTSMNVSQALRDYPDHQAGWWISADGWYDMHGATVAEAVAELLAQCADDDDRAGVYAGTLEVEVLAQ